MDAYVQSMTRNPEFPDTCKKLPVPRNIFPVNKRRELREKWLCAAIFCYEIGLGNPEIAKFPVKIPVSREFAWRRVRSALRRQPGIPRFREFPSLVAERPANGG